MAIIAYAFLDYNMQNQWSIPIFWDGSYRIGLFFQSVCSLTTFTPYDKTETAQRLKVPPPYLYHTKILGYISSNARTSPIDHTIKEPYTTNNIYQKKVFCIASRLADTEKDIPTAYPDITDCTISDQITTDQRTIYPIADKNHITLSCQSGSQHKSQSPT